MMAKKNNFKKNHSIHIRITTAENSKLDNLYKTSTCHSKAEYAREAIFNRPVRIFYRNQSLDDLLEEIVILNREINTLKDKLSITAQRLYTHRNGTEDKELFQGIDVNVAVLNKKMDEVKNQIEKIVDKWLQS
jgi:predicted amino acid racemase